MSAIRTAASKHARTLSQPLRRSFYTPFAALQHSPLLAKKPTATTGNAAAATASNAAAHEHEREHAARTLHVVSEPNAADFKYGVPAGAYPNAAPYQATLENVSPASSTSSVGAHPVLTRAAWRDTAGVVGATSASCGRGLGFEGGDEGSEARTRSKDTEDVLPRLASRNLPPVQAYGEGDGVLVLRKHGSVESRK